MQHPPLPYSDFAPPFPAPAPIPAPAFFPVADFSTCDATLLSSAESNSFFGFLDKFDWDFDPSLPNALPIFSPPSSAASDGTAHSASSVHSHSPRGTPVHALDEQPYPPQQQQQQHQPHLPSHQHHHPYSHSLRSSASASSASPPPSAGAPHPSSPHHNHTARTKPLLSTPQKRLNHIMSEQKRRNAIRDGYATLTNMLAPAGAPVGSGIPTRGRPKGSGARGKNGSEGAKGKSGVLFRAVEYCKWLEEGCDALRREVERIEIAAGCGAEVY